MSHQAIVELEFKDNPAQLLRVLGLRTKQFEKIKGNIQTRLISKPRLQMIVLEFRRGGMFYGEIEYGSKDNYTEARKRRSEAIGRAARRDSGGPEEPEVNGDDGILDGEADQSGWGLESLLRREIAERGSQRPGEANRGD